MNGINVLNQIIKRKGASPNEPLTSPVLMRLIAMCARKLCSAKTVQIPRFDVQSTLLHCPRIQMAGDIFSIERGARKGTNAVGGDRDFRVFAEGHGIK